MTSASVLDFFLLCGQIKRTVRTGWARCLVPKPESVSDHMYRMALMAILIPTSEPICSERLVKMAIVHDLAECIVGDITPYCGITKEEKLAREQSAMDQLCALIPEDKRKEIMDLWNDYNSQSSPESRLCKDLDRYEMLVQAFEYEREMNAPGKLESFYEHTKGSFQTELVKKWVEELNSRRELWQAKPQTE